ncbi:hypothetical protein [Streptomyces lydicus]|uniref:hypothetical protein n=1 Tax=Streptomyces lydicus TaxID=47763 RepID=UPI0036EFA689
MADFNTATQGFDQYVHDPAQLHHPPHWKLFARAYLWIPSNLFIGPEGGAYRDDDPGPGFDTASGGIVGRAAYRLRYDAYLRMQWFVGDPGQYDQDGLSALASYQSMLNARTVPWPLNAGEWIRDVPPPPPGGPKWRVRPNWPSAIAEEPSAVEGTPLSAGDITPPGKLTADEPSPVEKGIPTAVGEIEPMGSIPVKSGKTIGLDMVDYEPDRFCVEHGSMGSTGIGLADLCHWCTENFGAAFPREIAAGPSIRNFVVDVETYPTRRIIRFTISLGFSIAGSDAGLVLGFECTRTQSGGKTTTGFDIRADLSFETGSGDERPQRVWFMGRIARDPAKGWSVTAAWRDFGDGLTIQDVARGLGLDRPEESELADLIPPLRGVALTYSFGNDTLGASFTADNATVAFVSLPPER